MCNGMLEAAIKALGPHTSANRRHLSLLLILTVVSTGHGSGCVHPYMVQNSWVNLTETNRGTIPVGTVLQYSCDPGYLADGPSTITCSPLGLWSADAPRCIRSDVCLPPLEPENGGFSCHPAPCRRLTHGTVIEYFCEEGFIMKGDYKYLTCQDAQWDLPMQISCVSQGCVRPFLIQHGSIHLAEPARGTIPVGTVLQYSCDPGYLADGPSTITCSPLGLWSADAPRCIRSDVCLPPLEPENGGYTCHPAPCRRLTHGTVIEYFCEEGFILKGDYKYLTCQEGGWDGPMQISCLLDQERSPALPLGMPTLSIVASTASSVALLLLLVVLFVLLQPRLKSFHHSRREHGVSGQPVSIMVEGVQVTLPSYEEAVCGGGGGGGAPASTGLISEARVQIVLSEGQADTRTSGPPCFSQHSEMVVVHPVPSSSPSPSCWVEHAASPSSPPPLRRLSSGSEQHSLPLLEADMDFSDDMPLLKEV
ncbi:sushi domain-containing protein 6-like [Osmerus eperlanus]|uniref:sushi domain-containing protein 6-like n=1 Tax=Osmerus eperlanus TaxID=29151 RepID=UPI002E0E0533